MKSRWDLRRVGALIALIVSASAMQNAYAAGAKHSQAQRGAVLLRNLCSQCHAVGRTGKSPFSGAPPFRTLHNRYPVEQLEESLAEGIMSGHPAMPQFQLDAGQVRDVIAYLKTLERK